MKDAKLLSFNAVIEVDGKIITIGNEPGGEVVEPAPFDPDVDYAADGWSVGMAFGLLVRNEAIDAHLSAMLAGDIYQQQVAGEQPRNFCVLIPGRDYPPETYRLFNRNYQQNQSSYIGGSMMGATLYGSFYPEAARDETDTTYPFDVIYGPAWPGAVTPVRGFNIKAVHAPLAATVISSLDRRADALKRASENPGRPVFGSQ